MADRTPTRDLGSGWLVATARDGGLDLRVPQRGRIWGTAVATALAVGWVGGALYAVAAGQPLPLGASPPVTVGIGLLLTGLALWIAIGTEGWYVAPNCLEHRVGIGRWRHVRRYSDAALEIVARHDRLGRPYYRLYVVVGGAQYFVLERPLAELSAWAHLVAAQTGWPRRGNA